MFYKLRWKEFYYLLDEYCKEFFCLLDEYSSYNQIAIAIDYQEKTFHMSKWVEAIATSINKAQEVVRFLHEINFMLFGTPQNL